MKQDKHNLPKRVVVTDPYSTPGNADQVLPSAGAVGTGTEPKPD